MDFLDVTFDLASGRYHPYRKPNDAPRYIHTKSNHPPNILRNLPAMINRRVSDISCDEEAFTNAAPAYRAALSASGFPGAMVLDGGGPTKKNKQRRNRHNMVQPTIQQICIHQYWSEVFQTSQQTCPCRVATTQDLQQKHIEVELLLHAQHVLPDEGT